MKANFASLRDASVAAGLILVSGATGTVQAADSSGVYAAITGGIGAVKDESFQFTPAAGASVTNTARLGSGWLAGATVGYRVNETIRFEAEYIYRDNKLDAVAVPQFGGATATGDYNSVHIMANAAFDFANVPIGTARLRPYVGAGLGWAQEIDADLVAPGRTNLEFSGNKFAYQALAGLRIEYDSGLYSSIGLSYGGTSNIKLKGSSGTTGTLTADYQPLSIRISAGYRF
jgi:outer membrane protein W